MIEAAGPHLKLLVAISDWSKADNVVELLRHDVLLHYQCKAEGTANSDILDMFGLGSTDKFVSFCMTLATDANRLLAELAEAMSLNGKGKGIAFSVPISGAGMSLHRMLEAFGKEMGENEVETPAVKNDLTHDLIMAVINRGYSDELMEAARSAGASGGTIIHAKHTGHDGPSRFLGICAQAEKEIVMILAPRKERNEIMKAISHRCGAKTEAQGITLSLPVDGVFGLSEAINNNSEA